MQEEETINQDPVEETVIVPPQEESPVKNPPPSPSHFFSFNLGTILGGIALLGVIFLFVQKFACQKTPEPFPVIPIQKVTGKTLSVVFVNTDSLNEHYEYVKTMRADLESHGEKLRKEVLAEQTTLESEAAEFQKKVAAGQIPEDRAKQQYEDLMKRQQSLMEKKDRYTQQVSEMELRMNIRLVDTVTAFLKRFNRNYHFDYILTYKTAGDVLVANDTLDITRAVIEALNQEYRQRKK